MNQDLRRKAVVFMHLSKRGKKIYGERLGKGGKRENLVAGRRKRKKDLIAPMIFTGSLNAEGFEGWLSCIFITLSSKFLQY